VPILKERNVRFAIGLENLKRIKSFSKNEISSSVTGCSPVVFGLNVLEGQFSMRGVSWGKEKNNKRICQKNSSREKKIKLKILPS
jgi:hypothetical protein